MADDRLIKKILWIQRIKETELYLTLHTELGVKRCSLPR